MATSIDLHWPFAGRWMVQNSPADRVPSHGSSRFAASYAIDFVPVDADGRTAPITLRSLLRPEPPEGFAGFGRALLAPLAGVVVAADDTAPDHPAHRGIPSITYALTQQRRAAAGWAALAGNHVLIENDGVVVALCHLQCGSLRVRPGQRVHAGDPVGQCGNSGNSTEPHVHVQAMDDLDLTRARPVPTTFSGATPKNGQIVTASPPPRHPRDSKTGI